MPAARTAAPSMWAQMSLWGSPTVHGAKPFVKWVGGKRNLLPVITPLLDTAPTRYIEPFVGGGAVFFATQHSPAVLNDVNRRLIATYRAVRDDLPALLGLLADHAAQDGEEHFYRSRERFNEPDCDGVEVAALFIYLNKTCFNGLFRESRSGRFNTPWGKYVSPNIIDEPNLAACSKALSAADLQCGSWSQIEPERGDVWYLDPPYHDTFTQYAAGDFGEDEQAHLAEHCRRISDVGGRFLLSNSDTPLIRELYAGFRLRVVSAARNVSARGDQRGNVDELLISN